MDTETINRIVEEVLARLGQGGSTTGTPAGDADEASAANGTAGSARPASPAPATLQAENVRAPRPGAAYQSLGAAREPAGGVPQAPGNARSTGPTKPLAKVFVTAEMLQQRLKGDARGAVELAHNERLTPNAQDLVDLKHLTVRTAPEPVFSNGDACSEAACETGGGTSGGGNPGRPDGGDPLSPTLEASLAGANPVAPAAPAATGGIGLVTERPDAKVEGLLGGLSHDGLAMVNFNRTDCWMRNVEALGRAVASGSVPAGVAILPYAADAMLLAGKIPGVRPVQGTRPDSVAAAVRHFGANLLILEHAFSTFHEMRMMIRGFAGARSAPVNGPLVQTVAELERRRQ